VCVNKPREADKQHRQPGYLGVLRRVAEGVAEEARTRGIASLTFIRFAFIDVTTLFELMQQTNQFEDVPKLESV
jgi:hypothetical protein